jgi:ubiquitin carboxyl-terminal hydrolase 25/28
VQLDEDLIAQLNQEQVYVNAEIEELRSSVVKLKEELESIWSTETKVPYELTSVFVHRGASPSWGHYFFYSRNLPDQPDVWFKYNDSDVTEVSKDEVLADTTGSTANPYLVSYSVPAVITMLRALEACFFTQRIRSHSNGQTL